MSTGNTDRSEDWARALSSGSPDQQVESLRQIAGEDQVHQLTATVIGLAGSSDDEVRMWASEALESAIQPSSDEVLRLVQMLESAVDGEVCYWAATMLGRLGPDASPASNALEACLRESMYLPARERATWALSQIGPAASVALPALKEAIGSAPPRLRQLAAEALDAIGESADAEVTGPDGTADGTGEAAA